MTKIKTCVCQNKWQDKRYGKGKRVHNETTKGDAERWRCTVCSRTQP